MSISQELTGQSPERYGLKWAGRLWEKFSRREKFPAVTSDASVVVYLPRAESELKRGLRAGWVTRASFHNISALWQRTKQEELSQTGGKFKGMWLLDSKKSECNEEVKLTGTHARQSTPCNHPLFIDVIYLYVYFSLKMGLFSFFRPCVCNPCFRWLTKRVRKTKYFSHESLLAINY